MSGTLDVVGIGPGSLSLMTPMAKIAISNADFVVGYKPYLDMISPLLGGKETSASGMTREVDRAAVAVDAALAGRNVAIISSGDAGMYAMGPLVYELLAQKEWKNDDTVKVTMIPGITAANACASLVGVPLGHDSCTISLSDLLTPMSLIEKRIEAAAVADFAITFYNPRSRRRTEQILTAQKILLKHRHADTPVAIVDNAYRPEQSIQISKLSEFTDCEFGMTAAVIVGNSQSYEFENLIITPRGYSKKYDLETGSIKAGQKRGRSLNEVQLEKVV
ncbi:precorrin-3B C(17)-methyltransferase [Shewanella livingstonensis]|uniref:Precorrin-3B C(17)-methyltransferase n=1 Tax=Shewanella livingstonensis TaxID=150120 RepID=A0A3G8LU53_9GAMM|nr:precorrin-3B C(17)-methyltransferase [Shewanella livingstonensis]AZG73313.1 precorrin-3B C(17)-methyltransferase [Shewanella livingstonensis]